MRYLIVTAMFLTLPALAANAGGFQVIVNDSVKDGALTQEQFKQILLANRTTWSDGKKVVIVTFSPGTQEADSISNEFMAMTSIQAKKYYLTKVFNGVLPSVPASGDSIEEVVEAVAKTPGAVAVVPKGTSAGKAKVLNLN